VLGNGGSRRARIYGPWMVVSLNSRLESNKEEEEWRLPEAGMIVPEVMSRFTLPA